MHNAIERADALKIHITEQNTKIGKVSNLSILPYTDCPEGIRNICIKHCYARAAMHFRRNNVLTNWIENSQIFRTDIKI